MVASPHFTTLSMAVTSSSIHGGASFFRRVDVGNLHAPRAPIQERRDDLRPVPSRAHDGGHAGEFGGGHDRASIRQAAEVLP